MLFSSGYDLLSRSNSSSSPRALAAPLQKWHLLSGLRTNRGTGAPSPAKTASAIKIDGAGQCSDVNRVDKDNSVIAVGGGAVAPVPLEDGLQEGPRTGDSQLRPRCGPDPRGRDHAF